MNEEISLKNWMIVRKQLHIEELGGVGQSSFKML